AAAPAGTSASSAAGTVALRSQYSSRSGMAMNPVVMGDSSLPGDRALVPLAEREMRQPAQHQKNHDAGARDHEERREHPGNLHRVAGLENAIREAGLRAARPRDELRH